ncbi:molybdenum cofactor guanylyltransferase MobA [Methylibium petroleiphilum]|uniref:Molybdenum cofactor guanylyltransferase n=1 Tax=Methylibium petroleiphilum (strain ATCC BAA-1232 / LMG 22953 / PM1) TaxID=420662 RepID=MOBA_METPP|nr:molybdenum cofactor guanylyltransferase MobA [Methylibium petroleiphilum]A2SIT7.1 RecName: Full=Molybdenum cofactor guanylyltransferase; Short=MoCo guanylyltransferase; AltName: Full=GTP:molybdopterin guanylyltransferase; AltName: Full=Mo-MPT guanylyltransferase; AltName: Full=Molybdopterin guanylyltransferase; AltName: Full=Molybdopterin-guanine dinucleotide synthase; Short=MGD synthase [Methylibium petroleiphilum PM1]ABM95476.1 molybdenum cofactor guanylyltransferase [Methylibium petroleiphi
MIGAEHITGVVLAGGRGSRMGGVDKGLQPYRGIPLALHALMRLQPQVGTTMINANRNLAAYESFGVPVWPDTDPDFAGPLSGFLVGLERAETPFVVTVPCDTPDFPDDLVARLAHALEAEDAELAMVRAPDSADAPGAPRPQPVFCLLRSTLLESLVRFVHAGGRKIDRWTAQHRCAMVDFDAAPFFNANTLDELRRLETQRV